MKTIIKSILGFVLLIGVGIVLVKYYPYIFARTVIGKVEKVERVSNAFALVGGSVEANAKNIFSFAVAIKDEKANEILTASTEDRQWAVVDPGKCAEAKFFPYPPWNFEKSGTYHNARLVRLFDCP